MVLAAHQCHNITLIFYNPQNMSVIHPVNGTLEHPKESKVLENN